MEQIADVVQMDEKGSGRRLAKGMGEDKKLKERGTANPFRRAVRKRSARNTSRVQIKTRKHNPAKASSKGPIGPNSKKK
jgi:hypothetical protein